MKKRIAALVVLCLTGTGGPSLAEAGYSDEMYGSDHSSDYERSRAQRQEMWGPDPEGRALENIERWERFQRYEKIRKAVPRVAAGAAAAAVAAHAAKKEQERQEQEAAAAKAEQERLAREQWERDHPEEARRQREEERRRAEAAAEADRRRSSCRSMCLSNQKTCEIGCDGRSDKSPNWATASPRSYCYGDCAQAKRYCDDSCN